MRVLVDPSPGTTSDAAISIEKPKEVDVLLKNESVSVLIDGTTILRIAGIKRLSIEDLREDLK